MLRSTERKLSYSIALLLSTPKRKTFEALGEATGLSGDTIARLTKYAANVKDLVAIAKQVLHRRKNVYLLLDDTLLKKIYSRCIEGTSDNYSSSDGATHRSHCSVVAMLTDGVTAIPVDQRIWTSKNSAKGNMQENGNLQNCWFLQYRLMLKYKQ